MHHNNSSLIEWAKIERYDHNIYNVNIGANAWITPNFQLCLLYYLDYITFVRVGNGGVD
jgi:hypothetical protein